VGSYVVIFADHAALKHLVGKTDTKLRLIRWIMRLEEFDYEIKYTKGSKTTIVDYLSNNVTSDASQSFISYCFPDEHSFRLMWSHGLPI